MPVSLPLACADGLYRARFPLGSANAATFSPAAGTYTGPQQVSISTTTPYATIYFTIGTATPTVNSPVYTGPITVSSSEQVNVLVVAPDFFPSSIATALYTITAQQTATPTFSPIAGSYSSTQQVSISCTTLNSAIHYTLDGSTPTAASPTYSVPLAISATTTLKAIGITGGFTNSAVATAVYTISAAVPGYNGIIAISGNKWVNGAGVTILLKGANNSGLELCGPFGEHPWGGNPPSFALMQQWGFNCTRLPLNSASWLGQTTWSTSGSAFGAQNNLGVGNGTQDPFGDYHAAVFAYIDGSRTASMYPILELHWGAMTITIGGTTHPVSYQGQLAFMDQSGFTFWCDRTVGLVAALAVRYGTAAFNTANGFNGGAAGAFNNPAFGGASGFADCIFELFNEPFMGNAGETYGAGSADLALLNGGSCNKYVTNFGPPNITTPVTLAGYQQIVTGIRALGATNPIIVNGNQYAQNLQNYTTWKPVDSANQIAIGNHPYPINSYPYSGAPNLYYPLIGNDSGGPPAWLSHVQAILNAGIPVAITEDGGDSGTAANSGEPHISYVTQQAAANNLMYTAWTFGGQDYYQAFGTTSALNVLLRHNQAGTALIPLQGYGVVYYEYSSGNPAPSITTNPTLPSGFEGLTYNQQLAATGGAGAPFTWVKSSDTGTGLTLSASGLLSGTLTATVGTYTFQATATDQFGIPTAPVTFSLQATAQGPSPPQNLTLVAQGPGTATQQYSWTASTPGPGATIANYRVYRATPPAAFAFLAQVPATQLSYTDNTATNSSQNGTLAPSTVYQYGVTAVDSNNVESPMQTNATYWIYQQGVANQQQQDFSFNGSPNWQDTTGAPPGGGNCISFSYAAGGAGFQPVTFPPMAAQNYGGEIGAFNFFMIDVKITDLTHTFFLSHLSRPGYPGATDYFALAQAPNFLVNGTSAYGTPVLNGWCTLKVPLSLLSMGTTQFTGYISGTTLTQVSKQSGPGPDAGGYITGPGVAAGTFINAQPGNANGPFQVSVSQTVGSSAAPVALTCVRNNMYKASLGMNSFPNASKLYFNNLRWTVA